MAILLDTAGLLCYHNRADPQHQRAVAIVDSMVRKVLHSYVLAEFTALAQARRLPRHPALAFAAALLETPDITVVSVPEATHRAALTLLEARPDRSYSLCDAVGFVLMRYSRFTDALTTDAHFT